MHRASSMLTRKLTINLCVCTMKNGLWLANLWSLKNGFWLANLWSLKCWRLPPGRLYLC